MNGKKIAQITADLVFEIQKIENGKVQVEVTLRKDGEILFVFAPVPPAGARDLIWMRGITLGLHVDQPGSVHWEVIVPNPIPKKIIKNKSKKGKR